MNEHELFMAFLKKYHEMLTMTFKYYLPAGRPLPPTYEECFYPLYKIFESGSIEWINSEPLSQDLPIQIDLFSSLIPKADKPDNVTDKDPSAQNLEIPEQTKEKT